MKIKEPLLRLHRLRDEGSRYERFFKVYSTLISLEMCKTRNEEIPLFIEIAKEDDFVNNGQGYGLTLEEAKELIKTLQSAVDYLGS